MNKLNEIDSRVKMVKIVERLPIFLQWKWQAVKTVAETGDYPNINSLVTFLNFAAKEANGPVFGSLTFKSKNLKPQGRHGNTRRGTAFNFLAKDGMLHQSLELKGKFEALKKDGQSRPCSLCSGSHRLDACN